MLRVRSAIQDLVRKTYPQEYDPETKRTFYGKPVEKSYMDCLNEIATSQNTGFVRDPNIRMFRERLTRRKVTGMAFIKHIRWLYNQLNGKPSHNKISLFAPPLPHHDDVTEIEAMLKCVIDGDRGYTQTIVSSIQVVLEPFD